MPTEDDFKPKINNFVNDLGIGKIGEDIVNKQFSEYFKKVHLKTFDFDLFPEIQLQGIDQAVTISKATFDTKVRIYEFLKYKDVLLELKTGNKNGWYYTSKADYCVYGFLNESKTDLIRGYLIPQQDKQFRDCADAIINHCNKCPEYKVFLESKKTICSKCPFCTRINAISSYNGCKWNTESIAIKISIFPKNLLILFINKTEKYLENDVLDWKNVIKKPTVTKHDFGGYFK